MDKRAKTVIILAVVAVAGYMVYRYYKNKQAGGADNSPTGSLGTNLNSVAPELVGGSAGPAVGPAVSMPLNITLTEQVAPPPENTGAHPGGTAQKPVTGKHHGGPVHRLSNAANSSASDSGLDITDTEIPAGVTGSDEGVNP